MSDFDFQSEVTNLQPPAMSEVIGALKQGDTTIVKPTIVYGLSDLTDERFAELKPTWDSLSSANKHRIIQTLTQTSEANFEFNYRMIGMYGLEDASPLVRSASVDLLWEESSLEVLARFMQLAESDEDALVRTRAVMGFSRVILLGESEEIPAEQAQEAQRIALKLHNDPTQPLDVRRRALEAISNSSHQSIPKLIETAYNSDEHLMIVSAIFAMGRSYDERWQDILLEELEHTDNERVFEAVRACGEIQLSASVRQLEDLCDSDDREIQEASIIALGEIGDKQALRILDGLMNTVEDEDLLVMIEEAIDEASFSGTGAMFDFDLDDL